MQIVYIIGHGLRFEEKSTCCASELDQLALTPTVQHMVMHKSQHPGLLLLTEAPSALPGMLCAFELCKNKTGPIWCRFLGSMKAV